AHLSANSWTQQTNGWYYKSRYLDSRNYYEVAIKPVDPPIIVSTASVPTPLSQASSFGMLLGSIAPSVPAQTIRRRVRVNTAHKPLLMGAMVAKGQIDFSGGGVTTDGFDSSDPNYSTSGIYDRTKIKATGDVATNLRTAGAIAGGNAVIK